MSETANRIRQARRHADMSQSTLARKVGVHRSAVAQWEQRAGCHPTMENLARIAICTSVNFEWLATGRGRMSFESDIVGGEESPALLLEYSAQSETEVRGLTAMRRIDFRALLAVIEMMEALAEARELNPLRRAPYSR